MYVQKGTAKCVQSSETLCNQWTGREPVDECGRIINTLKSPIVRLTSVYKNPGRPKNQQSFPKAGFKTKMKKQKQTLIVNTVHVICCICSNSASSSSSSNIYRSSA